MKIPVKINDNYLFMGGIESEIPIQSVMQFGKLSIHGKWGYRLIFKTSQKQGLVMRSKAKGEIKKILDGIFKSIPAPPYEGCNWIDNHY